MNSYPKIKPATAPAIDADPVVRMAPVTASGLEQRLWGIGDIVMLIEEWETVAQ
jgi:hypothetical protein